MEAKEDELNALLVDQPTREPSLHPNLAEVYRERVDALHMALTDPHTKDEAFGIIRALIDEVRLVPVDGYGSRFVAPWPGSLVLFDEPLAWSYAPNAFCKNNAPAPRMTSSMPC